MRYACPMLMIMTLNIMVITTQDESCQKMLRTQLLFPKVDNCFTLRVVSCRRSKG